MALGKGSQVVESHGPGWGVLAVKVKRVYSHPRKWIRGMPGKGSLEHVDPRDGIGGHGKGSPNTSNNQHICGGQG